MIFLNTETNQYPLFIGDLELIGWHQGEELPNNFVQVVEVDQPTFLSGQTIDENFPEQDASGIWKQSWLVRDLTEEEILTGKIEKIRLKVQHGEKLTSEDIKLLSDNFME